MEGLISKYFYRQSLGHNNSPVPQHSFNQDEVYHKILRTIQTRQKSSFSTALFFRIAAVIVILISAGTLLYHYTQSPFFSNANLVRRDVAQGSTTMLSLEDGTKVWLNAGSKLTYPAKFDRESRKVQLAGEAYFEVVHLDHKPFIISSGAVKTVVLGTSFNISAYPENSEVEVTVLSGKVAVITPGKWNLHSNTMYLMPNQKLTYTSSQPDTKPATVNAGEAIDWKLGILLFRSTPLAQAVRELERKYAVKIVCADKIKDCRITARFDNEGLENALKVVTKIIDGTLIRQDGQYYLDGKGCD